MMKLNNRGYLIVEIIVASVIAMGIAYFLLELLVDLKNKNEDYYVNTLLETDKALMTKEVMNDVSNYKISSITSNNMDYVDFVFIDNNNEFTKRITIEENVFKYGIFENDEYIIDGNYFEKKFASELSVSGISITNNCYYPEVGYDLCGDPDDDSMKNVVDGLVTISIDAKTPYSDYNYGLELNVSYKRAATIVKKADDLTIITNDNNKFNNKGDYNVSITCTNANARWDYTNWKLDVYSIESPDKCDVSFTSRIDYLSQYIIDNEGTTQGNGQIINEKGYRYEGKNPNNYVLFNGELWRIIGVFDSDTHGISGNLTKIIRDDSIGSYAWDKNDINDWNASSLNTILNTYYYNSQNGTGQSACYSFSNGISGNCDFRYIGLDSSSRNMIQNVTWKIGGHNTASANAETFYTAERGSNVYSGRQTTWTGNVGLMYPSDYGYSVLSSSCSRNVNLDNYNTKKCAGESWIMKNGYEWTMTPLSSDMYFAFYITNYATILNINSTGNFFIVRPTVYLKSSVYIISGDGSQNNPYVLGI